MEWEDSSIGPMSGVVIGICTSHAMQGQITVLVKTCTKRKFIGKKLHVQISDLK